MEGGASGKSIIEQRYTFTPHFRELKNLQEKYDFEDLMKISGGEKRNAKSVQICTDENTIRPLHHSLIKRNLDFKIEKEKILA